MSGTADHGEHTGREQPGPDVGQVPADTDGGGPPVTPPVPVAAAGDGGPAVRSPLSGRLGWTAGFRGSCGAAVAFAAVGTAGWTGRVPRLLRSRGHGVRLDARSRGTLDSTIAIAASAATTDSTRSGSSMIDIATPPKASSAVQK